jgi:hypothetical protein
MNMDAADGRLLLLPCVKPQLRERQIRRPARRDDVRKGENEAAGSRIRYATIDVGAREENHEVDGGPVCDVGERWYSRR